MATRKVWRGFGARVILAAGVLALSGSLVPAAAVAPEVKQTSVDTTWSGSDRVISAVFNENLDAGTPTAPKTTAVLKRANGATMPIKSINVSNDTVTVFVDESAHPDLPAPAKVYMYPAWGPYTITFTAISKSVGTDPATVTRTFNVDGAAPSILVDEPGDSLPNFMGVRDNPWVIPAPIMGNQTIYMDAGAAVFAPGDPIRLSALIKDRTDANGRTTFTSGLKSLRVRLTDLATQDVTTIYSKLNTSCTGDTDADGMMDLGETWTLCTGTFDLLDHTNDENPGPDNAIDLSADIGPGLWSLQLVATDLSGLNSYTKPLNIIRLG